MTQKKKWIILIGMSVVLAGSIVGAGFAIDAVVKKTKNQESE